MMPSPNALYQHLLQYPEETQTARWMIDRQMDGRTGGRMDRPNVS